MFYREEVISIYDDAYAASYNTYYLAPWIKKHELNVQNIKRIIENLPSAEKRWLDLCCGQGWHFSQFPSNLEKIGVDLSRPQLELARTKNPDSIFIQADVLDVSFRRGSFDLVTNFWAAYCYLNSVSKIKTLVGKAIEWTKEGGAIYFEVLLPEDLKSFNRSQYAREMGFHVIPQEADFSEWSYKDPGGIHNMTSPPLELFRETLSKRFQEVEAKHDTGFMTHVIAVCKY